MNSNLYILIAILLKERALVPKRHQIRLKFVKRDWVIKIRVKSSINKITYHKLDQN